MTFQSYLVSQFAILDRCYYWIDVCCMTTHIIHAELQILLYLRRQVEYFYIHIFNFFATHIGAHRSSIVLGRLQYWFALTVEG